MKDKILKQIEEEALRRFPFIKVEHLDTGYPYDTNHERRAGFVQGAKFGYNIKESVDEKLVEALKGLDRFDFTYDGVYYKDNGDYVDYKEMMEAILSASKNTESNEGEKERLIDFLCYLNDNKMINNYDFDYEEQASEYLETINPPKEK